MTELEINKAVAEKLAIPHYVVMGKVLNAGSYSVFDPCNNVEQAWEIMLKYNICVTKSQRDNYVAFEGLVITGVDDADWIYDTWHSKPLVAAMLCFLEL